MGRPEFLMSCAALAQCPATAKEVAFIGRSNVGKSSLLGAVIGQQSLVRRSRTPGRTQLLNFFADAEGRVLVDLPGYGYAKMPGKVKAGLDRMIQEYIGGREELVALFLLIDARREGPSEDDLGCFDFARGHGRPVEVVVTKIDRLTKAGRKPALQKIETAMHLERGSALACSATSGEGVDQVRGRVVKLLGDAR